MVIYLTHRLMVALLVLVAPRWMFLGTYQPSTEGERHESQVVRNHLRKLEYKAKSVVFPRDK